MKELTLQRRNIVKYDQWFNSLLKDVDVSTTEYLTKNVLGIRFVLLDQDVSDSYAIRKIAFYSGSRTVCEAVNKIKRNDIVDKWIRENPGKPFGEVFLDKNIHRILISKTKNSRKYLVEGDIHAEIEEKFYPIS